MSQSWRSGISPVSQHEIALLELMARQAFSAMCIGDFELAEPALRWIVSCVQPPVSAAYAGGADHAAVDDTQPAARKLHRTGSGKQGRSDMAQPTVCPLEPL
ncbi:hypothetical protein SR41_17560 [Sphingomonas melonis]|uniref:Uncharacterized protein n=1 Tax=Sphingomonas melonis TaxID=152682 RepID=A0A0D1M1L9_9SPHN|nr:hypothetical protein SR41_17560 [Sphingomonas melonis]